MEEFRKNLTLRDYLSDSEKFEGVYFQSRDSLTSKDLAAKHYNVLEVKDNSIKIRPVSFDLKEGVKKVHGLVWIYSRNHLNDVAQFSEVKRIGGKKIRYTIEELAGAARKAHQIALKDPIKRKIYLFGDRSDVTKTLASFIECYSTPQSEIRLADGPNCNTLGIDVNYLLLAN